MKQFLKKSILQVVFLMEIIFSHAQVKTKTFEQKIPQRLLPVKKISIKEYEVTDPMGFDSLLRDGIKQNNLKEYKNVFAFPVIVDIDVLNNSKIFEVHDSVIYLFRVKGGNAKNLSIHFGKFKLSPNAILTLYTDKEITDSIKNNQNNEQNFWASRVYNGNTINIVLKVPSKEKGQNDLRITKLNFGFKRFGTDYFGKQGASADCNINVLCPEAAGWELERNSVSLIVAGGKEVGTGVLLMNTCGSNIPYLLTANHLYNGYPDLNSWVFQFQYWSTTCTPNSGWREDIQFNGASLKARYNHTDFALLLLNTIPPVNSGITYSGWNRSTIPATSATGLHHPSGDLMKFCHTFSSAASVVWRYPEETHWEVTFDQGIVQGGSSGSPLFDQNHRVIGQLEGNMINGCLVNDNDCFCTTNPIGDYGRFDISWIGGGTISTGLSQWLNPNNSGAITTNTTNVSALYTPPISLAISGSDHFCSGSQTYTVSGVPPGTIVIWSAQPSAYATLSPSGTSCTVTMNTSGAITLTVSISSASCYSASKAVYLGSLGSSDYPVTGPSSTNCNYYVTYSCPSLPGATNYSWFYPSGWSYVNGQGTNSVTLIANGNTGNYQIGVRVDNNCGTGGSYAIQNTFLNGCYNYYAYSVSPNPASSEVTVSTKEKQAKEDKEATTITEVNIYNQQGTLQRHKVYDKVNKVRLRIDDLPIGIYFIEIVNGDYRERQQLSVLK